MTTITAERVNEMLNSKGLVLNKNGLYDPKRYFMYNSTQDERVKFFENAATADPINIEKEAFKTMMKLIVLMVKPSQRKREIHSYSGKHVIEKFLNENYISNGEFIMAMMMHGFRWHHDSGTANVEFFGQWRITDYIIRQDWRQGNNSDMPRF